MRGMMIAFAALWMLLTAVLCWPSDNPIKAAKDAAQDAYWRSKGYYRCMCCDGVGYVRAQ